MAESPKHCCVTRPRLKGCLDFLGHRGIHWILGLSLWVRRPGASDDLAGQGADWGTYHFATVSEA